MVHTSPASRSTGTTSSAPVPTGPASPERRTVGRRLVGALAGAALAASVAGRATAWGADALFRTVSDSVMVAVIGAEVYLCVTVALTVVFGRSQQDRESVLGLRRPPERAMLLGAAAWMGAYVGAAALYVGAAALGASLTTVVDVLLGVGADGGRLGQASLPVAALILVRVCLLVPAAEELLFRGALFAWLRQRLSPAWAIGISGTLFGLMHQLPAFIPLAMIVGFAAGWVREKTGSTVVPIVMHVVQNVVFVVVSLVVTGWDATLPMG